MDYRTLTKELEEKLHLENASPEAKEEALIHIGDTIIERTMLAIVENLTEDESEMASNYLKEGDIEAFLQMIDQKHPELHDIVVAISQEVIKEFTAYLEDTP